jgi:dephospho-CoA kinase
MLKIALTGGIGSGKSIVAKYFAALGVPIIDADILARELTKKGSSALKKIAQHFGKELIDANGELKRRELGKIVFQNPAARRWLEKLLHPLIYKKTCAELKKTKAPYCLLVVPLLLETKVAGFRKILDRVLVVTAPQKDIIKRLQKRDGKTVLELKKIFVSQVDSKQRLKLADDVIYNNKSTIELRRSVKAMHQVYLWLALQ